MNLVELYDIVIQAQSLNGVPLSNGHVYVYALGRTRLMDTWSDVAGESLNTNPVILDNAGQAKIYVSDAFDYTLVFTDEYDNEIFSVDKYLLSQGAHSHADVAVAPSESIAVSSYNVGEVTVYVPYLTGQLGKVYTGIEPIVVNNVEDKISANHVPLGVQDPLYFVQDDEEGCIIGFSGQTIPEGVMSESGLGFENDKITGYNGSAFSAGNEYEAGENIDITNGVISGKDWSSEINDSSANAYSQSTAWTDSQGYLTGVDLSEYAKESFVISAIDSSTSGLLPTSAFATASGSFITALPDDLVYTGDITGFATTAQLDEKLDKADSANFYPMNSNPSGYINELPSDLATTGWVDSQGYLTAVDIPESAVWNATTQTVSANSAQWAGGTANPQIPVTSTSGISIFESGDKVYFNISADYAFTADLTGKQDSITFGYKDSAISSIDNSALYDNSAHARITTLAGRISDLSSNKLDTAIYANDSGTFLTGLPQDLVYTADIQDMATTGDLTGKQDITGMTAYATVESLTAKQDSGDYLSASDSANFLLTSDSGNFYPMNENPAGYLTAHQSLADYQTTADMVNYQMTAGMTAYQSAGDYYSASNPSGFISEVPETYLQNTDLTISDGKITEISGVPLSAGDELPSGILMESGLGYNAVNEISGYNGSAIAQYGAEKQWLVHDDTLVHAANSAQYALGVNLSAVAQLLGVDETVLYEGTWDLSSTTAQELPDSVYNFDKLRITWSPSNKSSTGVSEQYIFNNTKVTAFEQTWIGSVPDLTANNPWLFMIGLSADGNNLYYRGAYKVLLNGASKTNNSHESTIWKIVGIGRKA